MRQALSSPRVSCISWLYIRTVPTKDPLEHCIGFEWDEANITKKWERHHVAPEEAEDIFFHEPLIVRSDVRHAKREKRYYTLGQTSQGRQLFVAMAIRRKLLRVISVRDMNRNEAEMYAKTEKKSP